MRITGLLLTAAACLSLVACNKDKASDASAKATSTTTTATPASVKATDPGVLAIAVPTMQCEDCAATVTKATKAVPGVADANVDLDKKTIFVKVSNTTPATREQIENAITKSGYSTDTKQADSAAYSKLESCCKVGGKKMDKQ